MRIATVATITGAGIMAPIVQQNPAVNKELMVLATGAGSVILSHVNDAGFWLVKEYFHLSLPDTCKSWTAMETTALGSGTDPGLDTTVFGGIRAEPSKQNAIAHLESLCKEIKTSGIEWYRERPNRSSV